MLNKIAGIAIASAIAMGASTAFAADPSIVKAMKERPFTVEDKITRSECGDCHMVFPPQRLTQTAWKKIMATLDDHFGEDASLDAETVKHIEALLVSKALDAKGGIRTELRLKAWKKKGIVDPLRITETPEWTRHHTKKANYRVMAEKVGYKRGANCIKCHLGAEHGLYEDFGE